MLTDKQRVWIEEEVYRIVPVYRNEELFCASRKRTVADLRNLIREKLINELMNPEQSTIKTVSGVSVDIAHPDIANIKSLTALRKLDFFAHLEKGEQDRSYKELFDYISPPSGKQQDKTPAEK